MSFQSIRRILPKAIEHAGIKKHIDAVRVVESAEKTLQALWGEELAHKVRFVSFQSGILKATSSSPAAVQELKLLQTKFQNEVNRALGEQIVRTLNVFHV